MFEAGCLLSEKRGNPLLVVLVVVSVMSSWRGSGRGTFRGGNRGAGRGGSYAGRNGPGGGFVRSAGPSASGPNKKPKWESKDGKNEPPFMNLASSQDNDDEDMDFGMDVEDEFDNDDFMDLDDRTAPGKNK